MIDLLLFFTVEISADKKGLFLYANAGQNPPMFYSKNIKIYHASANGTPARTSSKFQV
jgi:serine phosphatase RsbU (regulator of sigma subunit)